MEDDVMKRLMELLLAPSVPQQRGLPIILPNETTEYSPSSENAYPYQPLTSPSQIRVLKIEPLESLESRSNLYLPLVCSLHVVDLENQPKDYDTLSYTWGDPLSLYTSTDRIIRAERWTERTFRITCDRVPVAVTANLYTALLAFRLTISRPGADYESQLASMGISKPIYLWIDALCINQNDIDERSSQVSIMHHIYSQAKATWVWLGGDDGTESAAIQTLTDISSISPKLVPSLIECSIHEEETYKKAGIQPISADTWVRIYAFMNRSWFKRAWIIQEVALAKKVVLTVGLKVHDFQCISDSFAFLNGTRWFDQIRQLAEPLIVGARNKGYFKTPVEDSNTTIKLYQPNLWPIVDITNLGTIQNTRAGLNLGEPGRTRPGASAVSLGVILHEQRFAQATDPRDKIFAFLHLSDEFHNHRELAFKELIQPNYRIPVAKLYTDTAMFLLESWNSLRALSLVQDAAENRVVNLPSWVPDFSAVGWPNPMEDGRPTPWQASASLGDFSIPKTVTEKLEVGGIRVSSVVQKYKFSINSLPALPWLKSLPHVSHIDRPDLNEKLKKYYHKADIRFWEKEHSQPMTSADIQEAPIKQSRFEVLWRTLLTDCFYGRHPAPTTCENAFESLILGQLIRKEMETVHKFLEGDIDGWEEGKKSIKLSVEQSKFLKGDNTTDGLPWSPAFIKVVSEFERTVPRKNSKAVNDAYQAFQNSFLDRLASIDEPGMYEIMAKMTQIGTHRRLFLTSDRRLGYGPMSLLPRDEVWLLVGADVPFLLRREGEGYRVIGEAYVHGIMHGEAVITTLGVGNRPTRIVLK
jgi:hypothetical protein